MTEVTPMNPAGKGRPSLPGEGDDTAQAVKSDGTTIEMIHSFGWYMRKYGTDAKAKGTTAIFCSMVPHKDWDGRQDQARPNRHLCEMDGRRGEGERCVLH